MKSHNIWSRTRVVRFEPLDACRSAVAPRYCRIMDMHVTAQPWLPIVLPLQLPSCLLAQRLSRLDQFRECSAWSMSAQVENQVAG